ncbi:putative GAF sensor protein [Planktothrix serta PCC 8927]|uniref:GAF sensor protein n=1 Tax=Planktothrix serta PCC 8927 TaxID=671068 RepID=A0A7Z9BS42_9CYAN|nr:response regulator [Planktothrix serta]VXD16381.1 putative GAF sensor protein [Planktothrix serta PCC 8927]
MEVEIPLLESVKRQLMNHQRPKKPKMLVVDDEPDNLDLLYRTFRRNFNVFKAESGVRALEILGDEGEVAVIISDQRMPEMKGTEFLSKTVPQFPNTVRIILTGFTDIEDLVDAINSGQVYKYITKPWDPNELKAVVERAAETYELLNQRTAELNRAQAQTQLLARVMEAAQVAANLESLLATIAQAVGEQFQADVCILQQIQDNHLTPTKGDYSRTGVVENWLATDPIVQEAMTTGTVQASINITADPALATLPHYQSSGIQAHINAPIIYRNQQIALLSVQWKQPCQMTPDDLTTVYLVVQQIALALTSLKP